jgi:hypothetical protein
VGVHQEDVTVRKDTATLPLKKQAPPSVAFACRADLDPINEDVETRSANGLTSYR